MINLFEPNKISATLLIDFARTQWGIDSGNASSQQQQHYLMLYDLCIKARAYAIINKGCLISAALAGFGALMWPALPAIIDACGFTSTLFNSTIVQTTITAFAAFTFGAYSYYKKRQLHIENLMRHTLFSHDAPAILIEHIIKEIEKIDAGFVLSNAPLKKEKDLSDQSTATVAAK